MYSWSSTDMTECKTRMLEAVGMECHVWVDGSKV